MIQEKDKKYAPYASPSSVIQVVQKFRETGLSWPITKEEIQRAGISSSLASRTLSALEFLNLIDENGERTESLNRLGRAPTDEYHNVLEEIIRSAYEDIFNFVNPATASDIELNDAFRGKQPEKQRSRMVSLFKGLCKEANILQGETPDIRPSTRTTTTSKAEKRENNISANQKKSLLDNEKDGIEFWYRKLEPLFYKLPNPTNPVWTSEQKENWHRALSAFLDLYISIEDDAGD